MNVLFVCTGNICRSPMAERVCWGVADRANVDIAASSAGVGALNGRPMHPFTAEVLTENGFDATDFESRYLLPRVLADADIVLCFTREHRAACQRMLPVRWRRMFTLVEFDELTSAVAEGGIDAVMAERGRIDTNAESLDIVDPMGQPKEHFGRVYQQIAPRVEALVDWAGRQ